MSTPPLPNSAWDALDADLILRVISSTFFSPFFAIWVPVFYISQGFKWWSSTVIGSYIYVGIVCGYWFLQYLDRAWVNGSLALSSPKLDWNEQVVVITGGSGGVGSLLANTLAIRGVTVAVLDVVPFDSENSNIEYYKCDISNWSEVQATAAKITEDLGAPTILINNAGVVQGKLITDLTPNDINQTIGVNTLAHFWTIKAFLPNMIKQKTGHIVTISSVLGMTGVPQLSDYCASKFAIIGLHESIRRELDYHYKTPLIRTTLVTPGYMLTPLFAAAHKQFTGRLYKFFVPPVQPHELVKRIIAALDTHESREIRIPAFVNLVGPIMAIVPSWVRSFNEWIAGSNTSMVGFVKVTGKRDDEVGEASGTSSKKVQ